jgi:DNA-binding FrmR family transcriptional regulator
MTSAKSPTHTLQSEDTIASISTRMKRAQGQIGGIIRMLEEGRNCDEIVTQMSAVSKAVHTAAFTLISASLEECIIAGRNDQKDVSEKLRKLFLSLA